MTIIITIIGKKILNNNLMTNVKKKLIMLPLVSEVDLTFIIKTTNLKKRDTHTRRHGRRRKRRC